MQDCILNIYKVPINKLTSSDWRDYQVNLNKPFKKIPVRSISIEYNYEKTSFNFGEVITQCVKESFAVFELPFLNFTIGACIAELQRDAVYLCTTKGHIFSGKIWSLEYPYKARFMITEIKKCFTADKKVLLPLKGIEIYREEFS